MKISKDEGIPRRVTVVFNGQKSFHFKMQVRRKDTLLKSIFDNSGTICGMKNIDKIEMTLMR